jgi:hypothetical protein
VVKPDIGQAQVPVGSVESSFICSDIVLLISNMSDATIRQWVVPYALHDDPTPQTASLLLITRNLDNLHSWTEATFEQQPGTV